MAQPDLHGASQWMKLCNTDEPENPTDPALVICVEVMETPGYDPGMTLKDAAFAFFCADTEHTACGPMTIVPSAGLHPERADFSSTLTYGEASWVVLTSVYRNLEGLLLSMFSIERHMQTREAKAIVESLVLGESTEITAPDFQPAQVLP